MSALSYRDLIVWQKAVDLVEAVYHASHDWPQDEMFGLRQQVRRAAISVPSNVAEGKGRTGAKEYLHHLSLAHGSLYEVGTQLYLAGRLRYITGETYEALEARVIEVSRLLQGLMRRLRT